MGSETRGRWATDELEKMRSDYAAGMSAAEIARSLGRSLGAVQNKLQRERVTKESSQAPSLDATGEQRRVDKTDGDARALDWTTSTPVRTEAEALAKAEIDQDLWEPQRCEITSWEGYAKDNDGNIVKVPLWRIRLGLRRRSGWGREAFLAQILAGIRGTARPRSRAKRPAPKGLLFELSIMDHHFGKLAWQPETGENYDTAIAAERYDAAACRLNQYAEEVRPGRILQVVGNDFYHVDKGDHTTTGGTVVDADGRWQKAFVTGLRCVRDAIDASRETAPVTVVVVPGNHDQERAFTLGVILEAIYERDNRVEIRNSPMSLQRFRWGATLLGFFHGHRMSRARFEQLPAEMAHHWPEDFAATRWREWHLGHLHSESSAVWRYRASECLGDIIVRRLPSLCGTDRWHFDSGYRSLGAAEAHLFEYQNGRVGSRVVSQIELEAMACR